MTFGFGSDADYARKELDRMTSCECGHPLWCHETFLRHPDFVSQEETPDVEPYVHGEPGECNHIGAGGWDCDCDTFMLHPYRDQMAAMYAKWGGGRIGGASAYEAAMIGRYKDEEDYAL